MGQQDNVPVNDELLMSIDLLKKGKGAKVYVWSSDKKQDWMEVIQIPKLLTKEDFDSFKNELVC